MAWLVLVLIGSGGVARSDALWTDDFSDALTYERWGPRCWALEAGEMRFSSPPHAARLIARVPDLTEGVFRARLTPGERVGNTYAFAGLLLFIDEGNYWQLLLVESPEGKRYMELVEMLDGVHQAQGGAGTSATRLPLEDAGDLASWQPDAEYALELTLSPEALVGTVTDPATGRFWRRTYGLEIGRAVKHGRPGLTTTALSGAFRAFTVEGPAPPRQTVWQLPAGRAGTVAVLGDQEGRLTGPWAKAFTDDGFGVLTLTWDDLLRGPLPVSDLDLLVLADATRVPTQARDAVTEALRSSGKVIAIGAPAFMQVLAVTPRGWVTEEGYGEALVGELKPVPIGIAPTAWRRSARHPEKPSTIEPAPGEGEDAWKLTIDLDGWDGFLADIPGAFGPDRSLLTFQARGDGNTSQLSLEIREEDGSRWIGMVPLSTGWRSYALSPQDFPYWKDSPAQRGAPGDVLHPERAQSLTIALSGSHTPKVGSGPHTVWIRALGTAAAPEGQVADFSIPSIEALSPSYMLFPLRTPVRLQAGAEQAILPADTGLQYDPEGYSPIWRERGRGFNRERSWRWVPLLEAIRGHDPIRAVSNGDRVPELPGRTVSNGDRAPESPAFHRGALVSLMIGDSVSPDAMWANVGVADPAVALHNGTLRGAVLSTAEAMARGCFLLEAGAPVFSCEPGEELTFGAEVLNAGRQPRELTVRLQIGTGVGMGVEGLRDETWRGRVEPGRRASPTWRLPAPTVPGPRSVTVTLQEGERVCDRITHDLIVEERKPAARDDFVRVEGDRFMLHGKPWYFKGINYRQTSMGGYAHLNLVARECYDPEILERDLAWMESIGINAISAYHALVPPDPDAPYAYRDQLDFLDRCERHGIKVFFFLPNARPFAGADPEWVKAYLDHAAIKNHPAVMCWELSWEPIHGPWNNGLDFALDPWNRWVVERYGSVENALADWGYRPELTGEGKLPVPTSEMVTQHGEWDVMVAAFRRAWSDILSRGYQEMVDPLRAFDPQHLISFRFGACSIPDGQRFAHAHSPGVLKHVDFMNPEGYSLMRGWTSVTPADDWRKGGLVTLYFRHFSREKPVVWMEFGYTVNGMQDPWAQPRVRIDPNQLAEQRAAYEALYGMFIESGARGAAPWWLPGGFRLGENSDFGILDPDGAERPACEVLRKYLPQFDAVRHDPPTATIDLDLDAHYADAWTTYADKYLRLVKAGERPGLRTAGTGTTSADCPLTAVGNRPYNGHNPPIYLDAEFNTLEVRSGNGNWQPVRAGETVQVTAGQPVRCRASVGNLGEAKWLATADEGGVFLAGRAEYGLEFAAPIAGDTPFLEDAAVPEFALLPQAAGETVVSFEMSAKGRAYFGERRTVTLKATP